MKWKFGITNLEELKQLKVIVHVQAKELHFQLKELKQLKVFLMFNTRNFSTPAHTDSHPCTSPPLWGTRVVVLCRIEVRFCWSY